MSELPDINIPISRVEIVRKAIHFKKPPRLPLIFEGLGITDVASYSMRPKIDRERMLRREPFTDEWGCRWEFTEMANMGQVKFHPLEDLDDMDSFSWPDYEDISRYEWILEDIFTQGDRYVRTGIFMILFERMHTLHGFEQTLQDLYLNRKRMEKLADHIVEVHCGIIENAANHFGDRTHAIHMTEDWGTQQATFISPELLRDFFKPRYRKMFDAMHSHGYDVWVHSCGKVNDFVEEFIDVGVDVINLQQPRALGIEDMGKRYRRRICFETLADIQATLPTGNRDQIICDVEMLLEHWATEDGGFILSDYGDGEAIGTDNDIKKFMLNAFLERDPYITYV